MTGAVPEYADFADLRRVGIGYAQEASGEIWTDYNLHDPGVTLLEQSCFALSELAYRIAHDPRDLLTDARGHFNFRDLALFRPRKVLNSDPVTTADLEIWLSACEGAASVTLMPAGAGGPGLYDLLVVPASEDVAHQPLYEAMARAFDAVRPLCCDRNAIRIARCREVQLAGQVEMIPDALPEFVAAQMYQAVSIILRGGAHGAEAGGITRQDAYAAPEAMLRGREGHRDHSLDLDNHLGDLRALPGLRDIGPLKLEPVGAPPDGAGPFYFASRLPRTAEEIALTVTLNGVPIPLDPVRLHEEFVRISAERIAQARHHFDATDWHVMRPGRRRDYSHRQVDGLLPGFYRAAMQSQADVGAGLKTYRQAIDGHLASIAGDLSELPRFFAAETDISTHDPATWHRRRALLDYLIALQGEEMPATRHTGLHHYLGDRARHGFELDWRLRYLLALPRLNAARITGPGPAGAGGFLGRLSILADLAAEQTVQAGIGGLLDDYGLRIGEDEAGGGPRAEMAGEDADPDAGYRLEDEPGMPPDLLDMLGMEAEARPFPAAALRDLVPWTGAGMISHRQFLRLADRRHLFLTPEGGGWSILFDDGAGRAPLRLARCDDHASARRDLARLLATWRQLHRDSEAMVLVEDILLRDGPRDVAGFRPHVAHLVLTGWTARCAIPAFRRYVEDLVEQHAPAHLLIRPLWLSLPGMRRFASLHAAARAGEAGAGGKLRDYLAKCEAGA
ncbi:hypothetical protein [Paracoccus marinaquae]|uniref:Uncharacterized protein n=1 Tax=Paracoccus marinaquae TaxID=2841926 RepID=A0ABS6AHP2_9RHOB|nr:hypothetical protein [Paracoccus marinaquae]MBU3030125.1 hypothetical protein [Paracoccus marinaquae]